MKIAVLGSGAIGGYFGARLAAGGHEVSFIARGAHLAVLRRQGLTVRSAAGDAMIKPVEPFRATGDPGEVGPVEVVLLGVKTWQLDGALAVIAPLIGPGTAVLTLQNGVEAPDLVAAAVCRDAVLPGLARIFANIEAPGVIRHVGGPASLTFAEWDDRPSDRVEQLRQALRECAVAVQTPLSIWSELWAKFLFVVPFGGLGAVTDAPIGVLRSRPGTRRLLVEAMREVAAVAAASGVSLAPDAVEVALAFVDQQPASGRSSLQRDLRAGVPSELEAWTGAVVRLGALAGVATPVNHQLYEVLSVIEARSSVGSTTMRLQS